MIAVPRRGSSEAQIASIDAGPLAASASTGTVRWCGVSPPSWARTRRLCSSMPGRSASMYVIRSP
jgi:hypothetical protein